jgi:hypothetical protein
VAGEHNHYDEKMRIAPKFRVYRAGGGDVKDGENGKLSSSENDSVRTQLKRLLAANRGLAGQEERDQACLNRQIK